MGLSSNLLTVRKHLILLILNCLKVPRANPNSSYMKIELSLRLEVINITKCSDDLNILYTVYQFLKSIAKKRMPINNIDKITLTKKQV